MEESDTGKQSSLLQRFVFYNKSVTALGSDEPINPNWEREIERRERERERERETRFNLKVRKHSKCREKN